MRVLLHTEESLPTALACAIRMDVFARQLRALGHEVTILTGSNNLDHGKKNGCPSDVIYAPATKLRKKTTLMRLLSNLSFAASSVCCAVDADDLLAARGLGRSMSPDHMEEIVVAFDEMVEHYDTIGQNRQTAMQKIREKHSRQSVVLKLETELKKLCGEKTKGAALQ